MKKFVLYVFAGLVEFSLSVRFVVYLYTSSLKAEIEELNDELIEMEADRMRHSREAIAFAKEEYKKTAGVANLIESRCTKAGEIADAYKYINDLENQKKWDEITRIDCTEAQGYR